MGVEDLEYFMGAIRRMESGSFGGNYAVVNSIGARGAYQILTDNWAPWASQAGIPGADWRDPRAQDAVARYKFLEYYRRYGSWDLVAMAWHGGEGTVRKYLRTGQLGPNTTSYVQRYGAHMAEYKQLMGAAPGFSEEDLVAGANVSGMARAARGQPFGQTASWFYPFFLNPEDQLAAYFESLQPPELAEVPDPTPALRSVFQSMSNIIRGGSTMPGGPGLDASQLELSKQATPDMEGSPYEELPDQG